MNRSMRAALGVVLVALAVPTAALATHHSADGLRHHRHGGRGGELGSTGATGAGSVQSYDNQTGALTILLPGTAGTITGTVTDGTRFECPHDSQGGGWGRGGPRRGDSGSSGWSGDTGASGSTGPHDGGGSSGGEGGSDGSGSPRHHHSNDYSPPPACERSLLTQGADVLGAQLELNGNGVFFESLELLPAVQ